jgi:GNAT superfamily N-acetyltransferase
MKENYINQIQKGIKLTNSYGSVKETLSLLENGSSNIDNQLYSLFFIQKTQFHFWRFYFYIQDLQKINWSFFKEKELITEIVVRDSKKEKWNLVLQEFQEKGNFKNYDSYIRLFKEKSEIKINKEDFSIIETANDLDLVFVQQLIENNFNKYSDKIPTLNELKTLVNTTFLIKEKGQIVAFFMTEKKGITLEFRYWLVLPEYRGKKFGKILMDYVLTFDPEIVRFTSWISLKNENVILAHKNLGFKEDGLTNYILYRE